MNEAQANTLFGKAIDCLQAGKPAEAESILKKLDQAIPSHPGVIYYLAMCVSLRGNKERAIALYERVIRLHPTFIEAYNNKGLDLNALGKHEEAVVCFKQAIQINPKFVEAYVNLGVSLNNLKRYDEAVSSFQQALMLRPEYPDAMVGLGASMIGLKRYDEGIELLSAVIDKTPHEPKAFYNLGVAYFELKRFDEALCAYTKAIEFNPNYEDAYNNAGLTLAALERYEEAIVAYEQALALHPRFAQAYNNLGVVLAEIKRDDEARANYLRALELKPSFAEAYNNLGLILIKQKHYDEGMGAYAKALELKPDYADAYNNLGIAFADLKYYDEALDAYGKAIAIKPDHAEAYKNLGIALNQMRRFEESIQAYAKALELKPKSKLLHGMLLNTQMKLCDWSGYPDAVARLHTLLEQGELAAQPLEITGLHFSLDELKKCAVHFSRENFGFMKTLSARSNEDHEKIKIAYLSGDFGDHPVSQLIVELFELHDRSRFEIIGICYGNSTEGPLRARVTQSFDQFIDVAKQSDVEVAEIIRNLEVDIAVELGGHTSGGRLGVLAARPAPVQVHFLGYPGTTGAQFIDYLVADNIVIPGSHQEFYTEKIAYLPDTFMPNDRSKQIAVINDSRMDHGLPEQGFVYCCFNNSIKITPEIFDIWMRLLARVEGSVLWLTKFDEITMANLVKEAKARGIGTERLVFAERMPSHEGHLARYRHADLFLDTFYYGAHTTASDALWVGLPVLTMLGETFASRVAASLLTAINLPELIADSPEAYEAMAFELATFPGKLTDIRRRLAVNRLNTPLFDTPRFTKYLENAYEQMVVRSQRGLAPAHIYVQ